MFAGLVEYTPSGLKSLKPCFFFFRLYFAKRNNISLIKKGPVDIRYLLKKNIFFQFS